MASQQQPRRPDWLGAVFLAIGVVIVLCLLCGGTVSAALWPVHPPATP